jgi:hypothetical protein
MWLFYAQEKINSGHSLLLCRQRRASQANGMPLACCILGKFLGVVCHCFPLPLDVPTFAARCLHVPINASAPVELWARRVRGFFRNDAFFTPFRDLLHAANLRHWANGFISPPKKGMLRIFSPEKSDGFGREGTRDLGYQRPAC